MCFKSYVFLFTQDPNADTEWNDVLRAKGILPPKQNQEITEDDIVGMLEQTIENKSSGRLSIFHRYMCVSRAKTIVDIS